MKHIIITLPLAFFIGCSSNAPKVAPSENSSVNSVSPSGVKNKSGFMQKSLESFIKDDWTPTLSKDKNIQKKYMKVDENNTSKEAEKNYVEDKDRSFTLQEYADKISAYTKAKPANHINSNVTKLNALPVIGK